MKFHIKAFLLAAIALMVLWACEPTAPSSPRQSLPRGGIITNGDSTQTPVAP